MVYGDGWNWPTPDNRWRSFEAEAFQVTAYRYDSRPPSVIKQDGFAGRAGRVNFNWPNTLFGDNTVFASASRAGVEHFMTYDAANFGGVNQQSHYFRRRGWRERWEPKRKRGLTFEEKAQLRHEALDIFDSCLREHLYRIIADTHVFFPLRDFHEKFDMNFAKFVTYRGQYLNREPRSLVKDRPHLLPGETSSPLYKIFVKRKYEALQDIHACNDEVHIQGPIHKRQATGLIDDRRGLGHDIGYVDLDWLDVAGAL